MKKRYMKGQVKVSKLKTVKLRKPSRDSYNELSNQLLATYPGCGHSCTSDKRLKKNIRDLHPVTDLVRKLRPVRFNWIDGYGANEEIGLIAQELELLFPEFVHEGKDGYKRIQYEKLTTILIKTLQEMERRIQDLEKNSK